jgi:hypothetical protein
VRSFITFAKPSVKFVVPVRATPPVSDASRYIAGKLPFSTFARREATE